MADPVDQDRLPVGGTWEGIVGIEGGIPTNYTQSTSIAPYTGSAGTINTAIDNAADDTFILLQAGTFNLSSSVTLDNSRVILRGEVDANGVPTTILNFTGGSEALIFMQTAGWDLSTTTQFTRRNVSSGVSRGSTQFTLASAPSGLAVGQILFISNPNVLGDGFFDLYQTDPFVQIVRVTNIAGSVVDFEPALNADYLTGTTQVGWRAQSNSLTRSGCENLSLTRNGGSGHYFKCQGNDECWIKNCKTFSVPSNTYHCMLYGCFRTEIRHCDMSHMSNLTNSTYCIFADQTSSALIVDNWFHDAPNIMPFLGLGGSAFAYNFIDELPYSPMDFLSQIVFQHGAHSHYNLFEGNWLATGYHDDSGSATCCTWFRNRMRGYDDVDPKTANTKCLGMESGHSKFTYAGNVLGENGHHTLVNGTHTSSDDSNTNHRIYSIHTSITDTDKIGNYNTVDDAVPAGEAIGGGDALIDSYLFSSKPSFAHFWPNITVANMTAFSGKADADNLLAAAYRAENSGAEPNWSAGGGDGPLTFSVLTQPTKGTLSGTEPNLTYTPTTDQTGADSFTFNVNDNLQDSATATVSLVLVPTSNAPIAHAKSVKVPEGVAVPIRLTGSGGTLTFSVESSPTKGSLSGTVPNLTYTPTGGQTGADSFTFKVNNGAQDSSTVTVSINIVATANAPIAHSKSVKVLENTATPIKLTGSGGTLTFAVVGSPTLGDLTGTAPNLTYTPDADETGADSFTFKVNNGSQDSSTVTVSINIIPIADAPVAHAKTVVLPEDVVTPIVLTGTI